MKIIKNNYGLPLDPRCAGMTRKNGSPLRGDDKDDISFDYLILFDYNNLYKLSQRYAEKNNSFYKI